MLEQFQLKFSVVIPAYNSQKYLAETLESVVNQTFPPYEVVVVDDGSIDQTAEIAASFGSPVEVVTTANRGVGHARNTGIDRVTGDWVFLNDADDIWAPDKLEKFALEIELNPNAIFGFSDFQTFGNESKKVRLQKEIQSVDLSQQFLSPVVCILPSAAAFRRTVNARFLEWAQNSGEDCFFFNDLSDEGEFFHIPELLVNYRKHSHSAQRQTGYRNLTGKNMIKRYMNNPRDRYRYGNTLIALIKQRRACRKWADVLDWCKIVETQFPSNLNLRAKTTGIRWSRWVYRLKDQFDAVGRN